MTILVAFASRHGATDEIAQAIGESLRSQGLSVDVRRVEDVESVMRYDAFVVGSAVYMGRWLRSARRFVERHAEALALRPTWLFSSGPVGTAQPSAADSFEAADLVEATGARDHHLFGGKLARSELGAAERAVVGAMRVPDSDNREWYAVAAWATAIGRSLETEARVASPARS
jgi:menaquinone-dependent protoporphyrinogen oxidase